MTPSSELMAPLAVSSSSSVYRATLIAFLGMTSTRYASKTVVDEVLRTYAFDSTGMANYFVEQASPAGAAALQASAGTASPTAQQWADFLSSRHGDVSDPWKAVTSVGLIRPGDFIAVTPAKKFGGAVLITAGNPELLSDGTYALRVFDSELTPHGLRDTRLSDRRAKKKAGFGNGTVRLYTDNSGQVTRIAWAMDRTGPALAGTRVVVGRASR
jgi:hypothetical protein